VVPQTINLSKKIIGTGQWQVVGLRILRVKGDKKVLKTDKSGTCLK